MPTLTLLCHTVALAVWAVMMIGAFDRGGWFLALGAFTWFLLSSLYAVNAGRLIAERDLAD